MKLNCFDADEPGNPNSQIKYEIVDQQPTGQSMFRVENDGRVVVANSNLDREVRQLLYILHNRLHVFALVLL